jgi:hypothetical protein
MHRRMLTGRCLCGTIRYAIDGDIGPIAFCHCAECRRASGSAFAANANVAAAEHRFTSGAEAVVEYESSPGKVRAFCGRCGAPMYSRTAAEPAVLRIRLGTLDQDPGGRPRLHVWTSEKAGWFEINDDLPRIPVLRVGG